MRLLLVPLLLATALIVALGVLAAPAVVGGGEAHRAVLRP
jgi:hypothetical protein